MSHDSTKNDISPMDSADSKPLSPPSPISYDPTHHKCYGQLRILRVDRTSMRSPCPCHVPDVDKIWRAWTQHVCHRLNNERNWGFYWARTPNFLSAVETGKDEIGWQKLSSELLLAYNKIRLQERSLIRCVHYSTKTFDPPLQHTCDPFQPAVDTGRLFLPGEV